MDVPTPIWMYESEYVRFLYIFYMFLCEEVYIERPVQILYSPKPHKFSLDLKICVVWVVYGTSIRESHFSSHLSVITLDMEKDLYP